MDLKFAIRSLRKNPGFTALAVFVMALGIGANTAVFTVVNTVLLKPLAYREPDRIVKLASLWKKSAGHGQVSAPDFHDWRRQSSAFNAMAYYAAGEASAIAGSSAEYTHIAIVTPDFFRVFQIEPLRGRLFTNEEEKPGSSGALVISHDYWHAGPSAITEALRQKVRERSPDVPVRFTTMEASLAENVAAPRFRTLLLVIFAGLAICLAMAGIYGVMAYVVSQRSSEIGLRMALGASSGDILRLVLGQSLTLAGIGLALGFAGAIAAARLLTSMLFEVKPTDPLTYAVVALLLGIVALVASYIPARRAINLDPLLALRQE